MVCAFEVHADEVLRPPHVDASHYEPVLVDDEDLGLRPRKPRLDQQQARKRLIR